MLQSLRVNILFFGGLNEDKPTAIPCFFICLYILLLTDWSYWQIRYCVQPFTLIGKDREEGEANNCTLPLVERDTTPLHTERKLNSLQNREFVRELAREFIRQNTRREKLFYKLQKENTDLIWKCDCLMSLWHVTKGMGRHHCHICLKSAPPRPTRSLPTAFVWHWISLHWLVLLKIVTPVQ